MAAMVASSAQQFIGGQCPPVGPVAPVAHRLERVTTNTPENRVLAAAMAPDGRSIAGHRDRQRLPTAGRQR